MDDIERTEQDHQILLELLEEKRKKVRIERIILIVILAFVGIFLLGIIGIAPKVIAAYKSYKEIVGYAEELHRQINNVINTYGATMQKVGDTINTYSDTFRQIAEIDFASIEETLKNAEALFKAFGYLFGI